MGNVLLNYTLYLNFTCYPLNVLVMFQNLIQDSMCASLALNLSVPYHS
jgi:hypothetical protein